MLEASFLRAEQSYLTPPEYDFYLLCESCVLDKLYNEMQTA